MTGFIGTAWISQALSQTATANWRTGCCTTASTRPGSMRSTRARHHLGTPERYTVEDGFGGNNSMNSFNHYSFGAVGQWMMAHSLGIEREEPGSGTFILQPEPDPDRGP